MPTRWRWAWFGRGRQPDRRRFFIICSVKHFTLLFFIVIMLYIGINVPSIDKLFDRGTECWTAEAASMAESPAFAAIDAVYTWVNGTDPVWIESLERAKNQLLIDQMLPSCRWQAQTVANCTPAVNCIRTPALVIRPQLANPHRYLANIIKSESYGDNFTVVFFHRLNFVKDYESKCVRVLDGKVYKFSPLLWILIEEDGGGGGGGPTGPILSLGSLVRFRENAFNVGCQDGDEFRHFFPIKQQPWQELACHNETRLLLYRATDNSVNVTEIIGSIRGDDHQYTVGHPVSLTVADLDFFRHNMDADENVAKNRFYDNDELRYSLRSVHQFAPWLRKIFIVTDGQIPRWLNLEHPKIRIVKHDEIFPNRSHLPTFSSAAIESHIHRIENLSKYFLYFNDDVILGKPIYPDDFVTQSRGFRVYLSWPVPNCADGCPLNWLNDGFCDKMCNSSKCLWDGGDCLNETIIAAQVSSQSSSASGFIGRHSGPLMAAPQCSPNCLDVWLGDSACDQVCNTSQCGYDMADCGLQMFHQLPSIQIRPDRSIYFYPENVSLVYLNFTHLNHYRALKRNGKPVGITVVDGKLGNSSQSIRSAVLNEQHQVLTLLFNADIKKENLIFNLTASFGKKKFFFSIFLLVNGTKEVDEFGPDDDRHVNLSSIIANDDDDYGTGLSRVSSPFRENERARPTSPQMMPFDVYSKRQQQDEGTPGSECEIDFDAVPESLRHKLKSIKARAGNSSAEQNFYSQLEALYHHLICHSNAKLEEAARIMAPLKYRVDLDRYFFSNGSVAFRSRTLLDAYADSLIYVNHLYNKEFGVVVRKVPAHMAHFIDRDIMFRLQRRFGPEFERTSAQRIRASTDMQLAFSYYYFMMSETKEMSYGDILSSYDVDHSGDLDQNELKTLALNMYKVPRISEDFVRQLNECCSGCGQMNGTGGFGPVTFQVLSQCMMLKEKILERFGKKLANQFETCNDDDVAFKMLRSNETLLETELNTLRIERKKFICLNDNFDHNESDEERFRLRSILEQFYLSLVPQKSPFELDVPNQFGYIDQYREWKHHIRDHSLVYQHFSYLFAFLNILFIIIIILHFLN